MNTHWDEYDQYLAKQQEEQWNAEMANQYNMDVMDYYLETKDRG